MVDKPKTGAAVTKKRRATTQKKATAKPMDWSAAVRRAETEARRNAPSIEAGETFRAQKPAGRESAPSERDPCATTSLL